MVRPSGCSQSSVGPTFRSGLRGSSERSGLPDARPKGRAYSGFHSTAAGIPGARVVRLARLLQLRWRESAAPSASSTDSPHSGTTRRFAATRGSACRRQARRPGSCARRGGSSPRSSCCDRSRHRRSALNGSVGGQLLRRHRRAIDDDLHRDLTAVADPGPFQVPVGLLVVPLLANGTDPASSRGSRPPARSPSRGRACPGGSGSRSFPPQFR